MHYFVNKKKGINNIYISTNKNFFLSVLIYIFVYMEIKDAKWSANDLDELWLEATNAQQKESDQNMANQLDYFDMDMNPRESTTSKLYKRVFDSSGLKYYLVETNSGVSTETPLPVHYPYTPAKPPRYIVFVLSYVSDGIAGQIHFRYDYNFDEFLIVEYGQRCLHVEYTSIEIHCDNLWGTSISQDQLNSIKNLILRELEYEFGTNDKEINITYMVCNITVPLDKMNDCTTVVDTIYTALTEMLDRFSIKFEYFVCVGENRTIVYEKNFIIVENLTRDKNKYCQDKAQIINVLPPQTNPSSYPVNSLISRLTNINYRYVFDFTLPFDRRGNVTYRNSIRPSGTDCNIL